MYISTVCFKSAIYWYLLNGNVKFQFCRCYAWIQLLNANQHLCKWILLFRQNWRAASLKCHYSSSGNSRKWNFFQLAQNCFQVDTSIIIIFLKAFFSFRRPISGKIDRKRAAYSEAYKLKNSINLGLWTQPELKRIVKSIYTGFVEI